MEKKFCKYAALFCLTLLFYQANSQHLALKDNYFFLYEKQYLERNLNPHLNMKPVFFPHYENYTDSICNKQCTGSVFFNEALFSRTQNGNFLSVNPILISDKNYNSSDNSVYIQNGLGVSSKARLNNKWYADVSIYGFSANYPLSIQTAIDTSGIIPHYGSDFFKVNNRYFSYETDIRLSYMPADYIRFETGKSRHFLGMGERSLFLSDNSASMPFVSTVVDVWRIKYRWMILQGKDYNITPNGFNNSLYEKYVSLHYLSVNLTDRINFNFYEAIVSNPYDQKGRKGLDVHYLNPVVFYRPIEFAAGTYDNALLGLGLSFRLFEKFYLHSQFIIDDMMISEIQQRSGWWANKYGLQAGIKAYDFLGAENLFFSGEANAVRPFTYSHSRDNTNYGNHQQELAHPEGANFIELHCKLNYSVGRFLYSLQLQALRSGRDIDNLYYGADIYRSYEFRNDNYGIEILQGEQYSKYSVAAFVSFLINPKINASLQAGTRFVYESTENFSDSRIQFHISLNTAVFYNVFDNL